MPESKVDDEANEVEDWDVTTSVFLPPLSSSPKIHTTDLYLQEKILNDIPISPTIDDHHGTSLPQEEDDDPDDDDSMKLRSGRRVRFEK